MINGRVVPIKVKDDKSVKKGIAKAGVAAGLTVSSVGVARRIQNSAESAFRASSLRRGAMQLLPNLKSVKANADRRQAAELFIKGKKLQSRSRLALSLGTAAASIFTASAAEDIIDAGSETNEISSFFASAAPVIGAIAFGRISGVKGGKSIAEVFKKVEVKGMSNTKRTIGKFKAARMKSKRAYNVKSMKKGKQLSLFDEMNKEERNNQIRAIIDRLK
jgi:hypothetical protein